MFRIWTPWGQVAHIFNEIHLANAGPRLTLSVGDAPQPDRSTTRAGSEARVRLGIGVAVPRPPSIERSVAHQLASSQQALSLGALGRAIVAEYQDEARNGPRVPRTGPGDATQGRGELSPIKVIEQARTSFSFRGRGRPVRR